ncbi:MAG: DNA-binding transcriptional activator [Dysgonomonas sp.]|nr:DNA-binding transcriptional activator [Dysgonomonas sp.]
MKKTLLVFSLILIFALNCISQGLQFQGYGILMEKRSSYSVFEETKPQFDKQFEINFDFSFHNTRSFGYIFLLKDKISKTEYNLIYGYEQEGKSFLKFNQEGKGNLVTIELNNEKLEQRSWIPISCKFLLDENIIRIKVEDKEYTIKRAELPPTFIPELVFGVNNNSVDVPSFSIRNLSVQGDKNNFIFPLNENEGNDVHDSKGKIVGKVTNPVWLINNSYYWRPRFETQSQSVSGINYHTSTQDMLFFNRDSILTYNMRINQSASEKYRNRLPLNMQLGTSFIDNENDKLYIYEVIDYSNPQCTFVSINLDNNKWENLSRSELPIQLHHHAGFHDSVNNRYIIFGGFGHQRYNDQLYTFDLITYQWDTLHYTGDKIMPRFFQGMAYDKGSLYIFGGLGNESGDQTIGRHNFYDLYKIDLEKKECSKLWEIDWKEKNVISARNMIILNDTSFYALCYPEYEPNSYVQLYEFSIRDGSYRILGDSIHFRSDKIATNVNLYYNDILQEFYCSVQEFEDDGSSTSKIYSISYPPITKKELTTYYKSESFFPVWYKIVILIIILVLCVYLLFLLLKKRKKSLLSKISAQEINFNQTRQIESSETRKNAIYLFGKFTVYDRAGKDITYMFSTRLKNAFLLILQHSSENGISSQLLSKSLWPDKDEYSVKNLRGVTLNQLRKIISELDDIELIYEKGSFRLIIGDNCYYDYSHFLKLVHSSNDTFEKITEIKNILSRGRFLDLEEDAILSSFKKDVDIKTHSILSVYIENTFDTENYYLTILLSEILLLTDTLDENAFLKQMLSYVKLKQLDEAKKNYALFVSNYKKQMNKDYPLSFSSILKKQ